MFGSTAWVCNDGPAGRSVRFKRSELQRVPVAEAIKVKSFTSVLISRVLGIQEGDGLKTVHAFCHGCLGVPNNLLWHVGCYITLILDAIIIISLCSSSGQETLCFLLLIKHVCLFIFRDHPMTNELTYNSRRAGKSVIAIYLLLITWEHYTIWQRERVVLP